MLDTTSMSSRERVRAFLSGQTIDCIPNGFGGTENTGLHNLAYEKLKRVLGVDDRANRVCTFMTNAVFEQPVLEAIGADMVLLGTKMCPSRFWGPDARGEWTDLPIWDSIVHVAREWDFRQDNDGTWWWENNCYGDKLKCPIGSKHFMPVFLEHPEYDGWSSENPSPDDFHPSHDFPDEFLRRLEEDAKWLTGNTPYSIVCGEMLESLQYRPGGRPAWWKRLIKEPAACHEFLGKAVDAALSQLKLLDEAVGSYCDMLMIAHDMGDKRGVTIGPDLWRAIYKPHYLKLFSGWHESTNMKVSLHCCGAITDILDDLIECGVDVLNPVQISADGMDPATLSERFRDRIVFYGGAYDAILYSQFESDEEVYEAVVKNITTLNRNDRYIFAGVHNLPPEMPEGHLRAMLRAYEDCRRLG